MQKKLSPVSNMEKLTKQDLSRNQELKKDTESEQTTKLDNKTQAQTGSEHN